MANYRNNYIYETSPRKIKPEYTPQKEEKNKTENTLKQSEKSKRKVRAAVANRKVKTLAYLTVIFFVLFAMGYQNSKINEQFSELKVSEKKLATIKKENEQLKVTIENNLNLGNLEQMAKEQLGMQKATTDQTRYIKLPKKDYVEVASEKIEINQEQNMFQKIISMIVNMVK